MPIRRIVYSQISLISIVLWLNGNLHVEARHSTVTAEVDSKAPAILPGLTLLFIQSVQYSYLYWRMLFGN